MKIKGKIIDFLGDSITSAVNVTDKENCRYDNYIFKNYGLKEAVNHGLGGTRLAYQKNPGHKDSNDHCFPYRAQFLREDADIIVVYGGINDYWHGDAPVGSIGDTAPDTYCGAVYYLMKFLKEKYPEKVIVFLTPAKSFCGNMDDLLPSIHPNKQSDAKPCLFYVDTIIETAKQFNIPVLDLYRSLPINPHIPEHKEKYTADGLHFNDEGHKLLGKVVAEFLLSL